jgi:hypothetical protein
MATVPDEFDEFGVFEDFGRQKKADFDFVRGTNFCTAQ